MKRPSLPPPWRKIAAALREFFKPETKQAPPAPAPAPLVPGPTPEQRALIAKIRRELPDALVRNVNRNVLARAERDAYERFLKAAVKPIADADGQLQLPF